jgi:septum site-determining protein MinC
MEQQTLIEPQIQNEAIWTLKILSQNASKLFDEVVRLVENGNGQFKHSAVILEVENKYFQANELAVLIEILTQNQMVVIGVRTQNQELIDFAKFSGLAVFDNFAVALTQEMQIEKCPISAPKMEQRLPKIVIGEVAESEQVLSKDSDLILLGSVKANADVIAHGSVSAYREMQGNVFAGIDGDEEATIFMNEFSAKLVSIAGVYKQFEKVPAKLHARSVMVDLKDGKLRFKIVT